MTDLQAERADPIAIGRKALDAGAWADARDALRAAAEAAPTPEALEGLGVALFWLDDPATIDAREDAYRRYRDRDDRLGAARVAIALAWDHVGFRGDEAVGMGWLRLAARALEGLETAPEHGWLAMQEADFALLLEVDPRRAEELAERTVEIGRAVGVLDIEMAGVAIGGLALVMQGRVAEGMRRLDAATAAAMAGDIDDLAIAGYTCCYLIGACEAVRDYPRAAQWCELFTAFCQEHNAISLLHLCRAHYASVLVERGRWPDAEAELVAAVAGLERSRPPLAAEALVRLAELRRRQGRLEEAAEVFEALGPHPAAAVGRAAIAVDAGDPASGAEIAERFLRQLAEGERAFRACALEVLVRARAAMGDAEGAAAASAELTEVAGLLGTGPLLAAALLGEAAALEAGGDRDAARLRAEDAVDAFERAGAPYGAAQARLVLSGLLDALGRATAAQREATAAARAFDHLGATRDAERARRLAAAGDRTTAPSPLTPRETEVLRLVAGGMSNADVAARLVISEHTVHRHLANILTKLSVPTRAAAVARAGALGLLPHGPSGP